jgi:ribosomal protein L16/L10AE
MHDDFLVVVADYWEAAQFMGGLYVDEKSMIGLIQWARGLEESPDTLLISIDGKYGAVAKMSDLRDAKSGHEWVYIGDIWAPVNRVKAEVQRLLVGQPEEARKLNLRAFQNAVPARIEFLPDGPLRPGWVSGEIHEAIRNIEGATDDALVWILMLGVTENLGLSEEVLERATREVKMRIDKGSEFRSTFFPLNAVTMKEIEARTRRAKRDLASFLTKFPSERDLNLDESQLNERFRRVEQYAARLSNDRLIELTVFLYNKEDWLGATFKHFLGEFDKRVARAGD